MHRHDVPRSVEMMAIRSYRNDDLDAVHHLVSWTIDKSYSATYSQEAVKFFKRYHSPENIVGDAHSGHTILVHRNDKLVGTGTLLGTNIRRVFVLPEEQGKGIGGRIVAELERLAARDRIGTVDLDSSTVSEGFYHHLGYVGIDTASSTSRTRAA